MAQWHCRDRANLLSVVALMGLLLVLAIPPKHSFKAPSYGGISTGKAVSIGVLRESTHYQSIVPTVTVSYPIFVEVVNANWGVQLEEFIFSKRNHLLDLLSRRWLWFWLGTAEGCAYGLGFNQAHSPNLLPKVDGNLLSAT